MELIEMAFKLILAVSLGGLIGLERESARKPAGLRTNTLICTGAAMMMILADMIVRSQGGLPDSLIRLSAGVIIGIGFIGAGTIIQTRGTAAGLTTAATIWVVAGLGLVVGAGYPVPAILFAAVIMATLVLFRKVEAATLKVSRFNFRLKVKENPEILSSLRKIAFHLGLRIEDLMLKKPRGRHVLSFSIQASDDKEEAFTGEIQNVKGLEELIVE